MTQIAKSPRMRLNTTDFKKIGKGMLIAGLAGAAVALGEYLQSGEFDMTTETVMALTSTLINFLIKLMSGGSASSQPREVDLGEDVPPYSRP